MANSSAVKKPHRQTRTSFIQRAITWLVLLAHLLTAIPTATAASLKLIVSASKQPTALVDIAQAAIYSGATHESRNTATTTAGIVSTGNVTITAGAVNNATGYIGASDRLAITATSLNNQGGQLFGNNDVSIRTTGTLDNTSGKITSGSNATLQAGTLVNSAGLVFAADKLTVNAASIDNSNTHNGSFNLGLLAGGDLSVTGGSINNSTGAIVGLGAVSVVATGTLNNTSGQIAGDTASVRAAQVINTGGRMDASRSLALEAPRTSADGVIASSGTLALTFEGDYTNTGTVSANGNLTVSTTGNYSNQGTVSAQQALSLTAGNLSNAAGAQINSQQTTLNVAGTIDNAGLINSTQGATQITTGSLNNSGRVYGDSVSIAGSVSNSGGAVIASRGGDVSITGSVNNSGGSEILSLASMTLNGSVSNVGSRISANSNLSIGGALSNQNAGITLGTETTTTNTPGNLYIIINGITYNATAGDVILTNNLPAGTYVLPSNAYPFARYGAATYASPIIAGGCTGGDGGTCYENNYLTNPLDPRWQVFQVAAPNTNGLVNPGPPPNALTGCTLSGGEPDTSGACGPWWDAVAVFNTAWQGRIVAANGQLDTAISQFNQDVLSRSIRTWTEQLVTGQTTVSPKVITSQPGEVLAGGSISLSGGVNQDSIIVAGGAISGGFGMNASTMATKTVTENGLQRDSIHTFSGGFGGGNGRFETPFQPIAFPPATTSAPINIARLDPYTAPGGNTAPGNTAPPVGPAAIVPAINATAGTARIPTERITNPANTAPAATGPGPVAASTPGGTVTLGSLVIPSATAVSATVATGTTVVALGQGPTTPLPGSVIAPQVRAAQTSATAQQLSQFAGLAASLPIAVQVQPVIVPGPTPTGAGAPGGGSTSVTVASAQPISGAGPNGPTAANTSQANKPAGASETAGGAALAAWGVVSTRVATTASVTGAATPAPVKGAGYTTATTSSRISPPTSQLFAINTAPGAGYLVETDPAFTNGASFLSSDYFFNQLQLNPELTMARYGDGFAEQRLVDDQILQLTGRRYLGNSTTSEAQYLALLNSGVAYAQQYQLTPGVALSAEQMAALTTDIVWLETRTITLADGSTTQALVPQVYLRRPQAGDITPTGALISGASINLINPAGTSFSNSGTLLANTSLNITAQDISNSGTLAGNRITLNAAQDINNIGGQIVGIRPVTTGATGQGSSTVALTAGRNINLVTTTQDTSRTLTGPGGVSTGAATTVNRIATVSGDTVSLTALNNINLTGAQITATGNLGLSATGAITASGITQTYTLNTPTGTSARGSSYYNAANTTTFATNLSAGNNLALNAGGAASLTGTNASAGNNLVINAASINIQAAIDSSAVDHKLVGAKGFNQNAIGSQNLAAGNFTAGNSITMLSSSTIGLAGTNIAADKGQTSLIAPGTITIAGLATTQTTNASSFNSSSGFLSNRTSSANSSSTAVIYEGSTISGNTVLIQSGTVGADGKLVKGTGAVAITGSTVAGQGDVLINSGNTVTLMGGQGSVNATSATSQSQSGLFSSGTTLTLGNRSTTTNQGTQGTNTTRTAVGSLEGSVLINAQGVVTIGAADLLAAQDLTVIGSDIKAIAQFDNTNATSRTVTRQSGLSVGIGAGGIAGAVNTAANSINAATSATSGRAATLLSIAAARDIYDAGQAIAAGGDPLKNASINVSIGASQSTSSSQVQSQTPQTATLAAGGTVSLQANTQTGVITTQGALIQGRNVDLTASAITLGAAQATTTSQSTNNASGWSLGANISATGISATASANRASGNATTTTLDNINTRVQAGETVRITTTGDTVLRGGVIQANTVQANIGGQLVIQSLQDTQTQTANQNASGFSLSVPITGGNFSASVNASQGKADGTYNSVNQPSGIFAGAGGFNLNVTGTTTLAGGLISSTATPDKNQLTTAALVTSNITNNATYSASTVGGSLGIGSSGIPLPKPDIPQDKNGNQTSTSQSAISPGSITLTGGNPETNAAQLAALNRDTTPSTPLTKLPDLSQTLSTQAQNAAALNAAGPAIFRTIGDIAQAKQEEAEARRREAEARVKANPNDAQAQADLNQANQDVAYWREGGTGKGILHGLGGLVLGGVQGAAGAVANESLLPTLVANAKELFPDPVPTGNAQADEAAWAKVNAQRADYLKLGSTLIGAATGGAAGGNVAQTATSNNFLTHGNVTAMKADLARCKAKPGGCDGSEEKAIINSYVTVSSNNMAAVELCIKQGNVACVNELQGQAATAGEVSAAIPFGFVSEANALIGRQNNVINYGSIKGPASLFGTDAQQAAEVASFRASNCQGISAGACDKLVSDAIDDRYTRFGVLTLAGMGTPIAARAVGGLRVVPKGPAAVKPGKVVVEEAAATTPRLPGPSGEATSSVTPTIRVVGQELLDASGTVISRNVNGTWVPVQSVAEPVSTTGGSPSPRPGFSGSGPTPGVIAITDNSPVGALSNYSPSGRTGVEFVFDPVTNTFAVGTPKPGLFQGSPHQQLAQSIGANESTVVGGTFSRGPDGSIVTTENSGHYGQNWTPEIWAKFQDWLSKRLGVPVNHQPWDKK